MSLLNQLVAGIDKAALLGFCRRLIQIRSYTGEEQAVAEEIVKTMTELGYDQAFIDDYGNVVGIIHGASEGPTILFDGHIDTVEVSDEVSWTTPPFGADIMNGRIFGRGASDMKGALAAMIYGLSRMTEAKNSMHGKVVVTGTICEETFEGLGLSKVIEKTVRPDYVVIGEASALSLKRGQRGRAEICLETFGKAAHSSNPAIGKNAVLMMLDLMAEVKQIPVPEDPFLGRGILELTDIISLPYPGASVVPHHCRVTLDRRLLVGETEENVLKPFRSCIDKLQARDPHFQAKVSIVEASQTCHTGAEMSGKRFFPAWILPQQDAFVQSALQGLRWTGIEPEVTKYSFCTNGSYSAGIAGIPTIGFGPGDEAGAHVVDESIDISQVNAAAEGYLGIAFSVTIPNKEETI